MILFFLLLSSLSSYAVAGITVREHLEVNIVPLQVRLCVHMYHSLKFDYVHVHVYNDSYNEIHTIHVQSTLAMFFIEEKKKGNPDSIHYIRASTIM